MTDRTMEWVKIELRGGPRDGETYPWRYAPANGQPPEQINFPRQSRRAMATVAEASASLGVLYDAYARTDSNYEYDIVRVDDLLLRQTHLPEEEFLRIVLEKKRPLIYSHQGEG